MKISVAMATYNGQEHLEEQLNSILMDLTNDDEIIISDDGSVDSSIDIIRKISEVHPNIKLVNGPRKGVFSNFENAISYCNNEIIFLSDQDDVWIQGKRDSICSLFNNTSVNVVMHDADKFTDDRVIESRFVKYRRGVIRNIAKSSYWGCCMAFRKSFIDQYLPFNVCNGIAHDQLIGLLGEYTSSSLFINSVFLKHRVHEHNVTHPLSIKNKIIFRIKLLSEFMIVVTHRRTSGKKHVKEI